MEKNQHISASSISEYLRRYSVTLCNALEQVSILELNAAAEQLKRAERIFVCGNGGSAAISEHLLCDFAKGAGLRVVSLTGNTALITALANDVGYESVFAKQLESHDAGARDVLICISSSGNSPNILFAVTYAKMFEMPVIGITGFSGGLLRQRADISLHVPADNYGIAEDAAQALMHCLAQWSVARVG